MDKKNDYLPFLDYFLGVVLKDYLDFNERVSLINHCLLYTSDAADDYS